MSPSKIPVAEKVTREVRSDMECDVREVLQAVAERENELFIHQSALTLAKRVSLSPFSPTEAGHILVPLRGQPARNHTPEPENLWEHLKQHDMAITDRTYFVIEAEALNHSQDRPCQLVAAYSTKDPYLGDLALVCFAESSMDLLRKLQTVQADHQKLLIHWGESKEELEQLPDVLRAYLSLKETAKAVPGKHIDDALQNLRSFFESNKKKRGRPRQDALSERVQELRRSDHSWGEIQIILNKETGVERTLNAYRNLLSSRRKPDGA